MRVQGVLVVEDRELHCQLQHLGLGAPLGRMQGIEAIEERTLVELLDLVHHLHVRSLAETTDTRACEIPLLHSVEERVRGASPAFQALRRDLGWRAC